MKFVCCGGKEEEGMNISETGTNTGDRSENGFGKCQVVFYGFLFDAKMYLLVTGKE